MVAELETSSKKRRLGASYKDAMAIQKRQQRKKKTGLPLYARGKRRKNYSCILCKK